MVKNKKENALKFTKGVFIGSVFIGVLTVSSFVFARQGGWRNEKPDSENSNTNQASKSFDYGASNHGKEDHSWDGEELNLVETSNLTGVEYEMLQFMYEEEKLARDVYVTLSDIWGQRVFENISFSEQRHMDMVADLVNYYEIENLSVSDKVGAFTNGDLQKLYDSLISQGEKSLVDALKVGATIEDLDIRDLEEYMEKTDNPNIETVFQSLLDGSENHMRAFIKNLDKHNEEYAVQFITNDRFEEILSSSNGGSHGGGRGRR